MRGRRSLSHAPVVGSILYSMPEVTQILEAIQAGDKAASSQLLPLVYHELRRLAQARMSDEASSLTLQPTALVHEAYLRLVDTQHPQNWNSKGHFFAAAANAMRRILIENARRKNTLRRGGDRNRVSLESFDLANPNDEQFLLTLDGLLDDLAKERPAAARVVDLRFFAGLSIEQTSEALDISVRTVNRHWSFAKAWLYSQLSENK